ncbi:CpaF family protein [Lachnospiraceae bacterium 62-35]
MDEKADNRNSLKKRIRQAVAEQLDDRRQTGDEELYEMIDEVIQKAAREEYLPLKERLCLRAGIFDSFRRLDILQELIDDKEITEIMVNGKEHIFIERRGHIEAWRKSFESEEQLEDMVQQIVSRVNRMVNMANPIADARLEDGSRVHIVLPPVALDGAAVTIRKFPDPITIKKLLSLGAVSKEAVEFLQKLILARYNIFISGGTGSGKTTFLNALSSFIPETERIITIEDSAELQIQQIPNLVRLETKNANVEGEGAVSIGDLIRASLRMRPDRIIIGEVRGKEAFDMLSAFNTGHDGSLSTGHGNNARDMLSRLETMVLMGADLPLMAIRSQIASAIDIMVHLGRLRDGSRKVLSIAEIGGMENGEITLNHIFRFEESGEAEGKVEGCLRKVGSLKAQGKLAAAGYSI